jgi:hypothetical protein
MTSIEPPSSIEIFNRTNSSPILSWKGKSFQQIMSIIKKNAQDISLNDLDTNSLPRTYFLPNPLKIYRREINIIDSSICNPRTSTTINEMGLPNGTITVSTYSINGLVTLMNPKTPDIQMENPLYNVCQYDDMNNIYVPVTNIQANSLRRLRSNGKMKTNYYTDTNQYLHKRSKTFQQNQFHYQSQTTTDPEKCDGRNLQNVYKTNNTRFETTGSVSSSSRIARLSYDTISGQSKYGNLLHYGANYNGYNIKLKKGQGFPMTRTPIFPNRKLPIKEDTDATTPTCNIIRPL